MFQISKLLFLCDLLRLCKIFTTPYFVEGLRPPLHFKNNPPLLGNPPPFLKIPDPPLILIKLTRLNPDKNVITIPQSLSK